ncbi:MAG TPA: SDR family oxidoreductase [Bacteroidota bacterium]|nr:SDR family oxidoreductase [Bacteroidota bacterium]
MKERAALRDRFRGKVAIVTGGSAGIGLATVRELCREGASVALTGIEPDLGAGVEQELKREGFDVLFLDGDMAEERFCGSVIRETLGKWNRVDLLVNNAFSFVAKGRDAGRSDWDRTMHVGPVAYATMASGVCEPMKRAGGGAIVNVSSISARIAQPNRWTYNSAKGAVENLTRCMALDLAPFGIRVNSVSPGWIWTREVEKAAGGDRAKWEPVWGEYHMLRRLGETVEVAAAILFLLSNDADFITGADLPVDGGYQGLGSEGLGSTSQFAGSH